jgi:hypothetical protein
LSSCSCLRQRPQHQAREFSAQAILTHATTKENIDPAGCHWRGSNIGALLRFHSVSGIAHALFVLAFMLVAAPLASFIPLSALAGVLVVVCWNMAEKEEFLRLLHDRRSASVLITTFGLTLIEDLTFGIIAGCVLAAAFAVIERVTFELKRRFP